MRQSVIRYVVRRQRARPQLPTAVPVVSPVRWATAVSGKSACYSQTWTTRHLADVQVDADVLAALDRATGVGWYPVVVTNGASRQQELKLRLTGLDRHLSGWVVSEAAGVSKPDRRIFELAGELTGTSLREGWMIGDHPAADIGGGEAAGFPTVTESNTGVSEWPRRLMDEAYVPFDLGRPKIKELFGIGGNAEAMRQAITRRRLRG